MSRIIDRLANHVASGDLTTADKQSRRIWLQNLGLVSASGAVLWACGEKADNKATAGETTKEDPKADADLVKVAMELESEAISLYTAAAGLSIWSSSTDAAVLSIAQAFGNHHVAHLGVLTSALETLKKADSTITDFVAKHSDDAAYVADAQTAGADLTTVIGVLRLAANKEAAAAVAYLGLVNTFTMSDTRKVTAEHGGDESAHYGVLRAALFALYSDTATVKDGAAVVPSSLASAFISPIKPA